MVHIKFGECLYLLLSILDISNKRLAKYLNVDPSLISKWVHSIRIPSYDSSYIDKITAYICENIINSFQEEKLNQLLNQPCFNINNQMTTKEKIKAVLIEAQGYSKESLSYTFRNQCYGEEIGLSNFQDKEAVNDIKNISSLSSEDLILFSKEEIFNKMVDMLLRASEINNVPDEPILISFFEGMRYLFLSGEYLRKLKTVISKLFKKGWKIIILINLNDNIDNITHIIRQIRFPYLDNNIKIYYLKKYSDVAVSKELFIIPKIDAMVCYSLNDNIMDTAFLFKNENAIQVLSRYFLNLVNKFSLPLYTSYPIHKKEKYNELLVAAEKAHGDQYFIGSNFHPLSMSVKQYSKYLNENYSKRVAENTLDKFKQRILALDQNLKVFNLKEIYIVESIFNYIKDQIYVFDNGHGYDKYRFTVKEVIRQIKNVIYRLKNFDNYEVGLINKNMINKGNKINLLIKEKNMAFIKADNIETNTTCISIDEPVVVNSFKLYFLELWEEIPLINKEKEYIISWLENQIDKLEKVDTKAI